MLPRLLTLVLAALLCGSGCTPVRTVYDANGNEVKDDDSGGEKDLMSTFEKRFDAAFSEKKTADGVPQTTSSKMSSFQRELDEARRIDKAFATSRFDTGRHLDLRSDSYAGAAKKFISGKDSLERTPSSLYSTDLRPDFMNESHGISHNKRYDVQRDARSSMEGKVLSTNNYQLSDYEPYTTSQESGYIESRRFKTEQPTIIKHTEYYRQYKHGIRALLGRDNDPL